jgi:son of sevenless-like protein
VKFIEKWVKNKYFEDIVTNQELKIAVKAFILQHSKNEQIHELLKYENAFRAEHILNPHLNKVKFEEPILNAFSTNSNYFNLMEWSEVEIARQITLITHYLYKSIQIKELFNAQWTKVDKHKLAPNVTKMIDRFNKLSLWASEEILSYDKAKFRAIMIEKFIKIAHELKNLNNYNDCLSIITALSSFPIRKLLRSWQRISFDSVRIWKELTTTCSICKNYAALREEIEKAKGKACIPYLGLFLKELAFIDEGPKYVKDKNLINVDKIRKVSKVIQQFLYFKEIIYFFKPVFKLAFLAEPNPVNEDQLADVSERLGILFFI